MKLCWLAKIIVGLSVVVCILIAAEAIFFYRVLSKGFFPEKAACVVILPESQERFIDGGRLLKAGVASNFSIIGFDAKRTKTWADQFGFPSAINPIISGKSRSTFEDALNIARISKTHGFDSILLVTSIHHLPRASFLLRMLMTDSEIKVKLYGASGDSEPALERLGPPVEKKMIFNEMVKFWGSLFELCVYKATDNLMSDSSIYIRLKNLITARILF